MDDTWFFLIQFQFNVRMHHFRNHIYNINLEIYTYKMSVQIHLLLLSVCLSPRNYPGINSQVHLYMRFLALEAQPVLSVVDAGASIGQEHGGCAVQAEARWGAQP